MNAGSVAEYQQNQDPETEIVERYMNNSESARSDQSNAPKSKPSKSVTNDGSASSDEGPFENGSVSTISELNQEKVKAAERKKCCSKKFWGRLDLMGLGKLKCSISIKQFCSRQQNQEIKRKMMIPREIPAAQMMSLMVDLEGAAFNL